MASQTGELWNKIVSSLVFDSTKWTNQGKWIRDTYFMAPKVGVTVQYRNGTTVVDSKTVSMLNYTNEIELTNLPDFNVKYSPANVSAISTLISVTALLVSTLASVIGPEAVILTGTTLTWTAALNGIKSALNGQLGKDAAQLIASWYAGPDQVIRGKSTSIINNTFTFDACYPSSKFFDVYGFAAFSKLEDLDTMWSNPIYMRGNSFLGARDDVYLISKIERSMYLAESDPSNAPYIAEGVVPVDLSTVDPSVDTIAINGTVVANWDAINNTWALL